MELLSRCILKVAAAYPFRLKRLLFLNSDSSHASIKGELTKVATGEGS